MVARIVGEFLSFLMGFVLAIVMIFIWKHQLDTLPPCGAVMVFLIGFRILCGIAEKEGYENVD